MLPLIEKLKYFMTPSLGILGGNSSKNRNPHKGENYLSIELANYLKKLTVEGKFNGVWTKIAHETSSRSLSYGVLMRNMGKNPGAGDFIFTNAKGCLWLELKCTKNLYLTSNQEFFRDWCIEQSVPYAVSTSLDTSIYYLQKYNFIEGEKIDDNSN
jgi:hypothetical protein